MKHYYFLSALFILFGSTDSYAQRSENFESQYEPIRTELTNWDPVRGEWLSQSIIAMADNNPIPDRSFPENFTPYQMLNQVPAPVRANISSIVNTTQSDSVDREVWGNIGNVVTRPNCQPVTGRSYGDPHLKSFDNARYSFQTVGEFVLAKSSDGSFEIQTRQKARQEDFSLNTAIAMNVGGDRVGIYASNFPDGNSSTPIRINGQAIEVTTRVYFLNNGGTIRKTGKTYIIDWPTGESVSAEMKGSGNGAFMNLTVQVYPCIRGGLNGLLGNANGQTRDDFNTRSTSGTRMVASTNVFGESSEYVEKQRLAWLAQDFADEHRITQATSLFDYPMGTSTLAFTDRSFPRVHRTLNDMTPDRRATAATNCRNNGVLDRDLDGCIFDNGFLDIKPSRELQIVDPSIGVVLADVNGVNRSNTNETPFKKTPVVREPSTIFDSPQNPKPQPVIQTSRGVEKQTVVKNSGTKTTSSSSTSKPKTVKVSTKTTTSPKSSTVSKPKSIFSSPKKSTIKPRVSTPKPSAPRPSAPKISSPKAPTRIGGGGF